MRTLAPLGVAALLVTVGLLGPGALSLSAQEARSYVNPRSPGAPNVTPFSGAVQVGNTLYLSGSLGLQGGELPATPEEEAMNVLNNVRANLEAAGFTMDDLVQVQVFCSDVDAYYDAFNTVYRTFFTDTFPARAFPGSGPLLRGARYEVIGIAVKR